MSPRSRFVRGKTAIAVWASVVAVGVGVMCGAAGAEASDHGGGHSDPFALILLELALAVLLSMFGRWLAIQAKQAAVLGELLIGVLVGNIGYWLGVPVFVMAMHLGDATKLFEQVWATGEPVAVAAQHVFSPDQLLPGKAGSRLLEIMTGQSGSTFVLLGLAIWAFSSLGVILLIFMVGLETTVREMLAVGPRAALVAILGVVAPFGLGMAGDLWMRPDASMPSHLFLAATLCATSVGITARVLKDIGKGRSPESRIILGAAVIDDILGLIVLAVVIGIVRQGEVQVGEASRIALLSLLFLAAVLFVGERLFVIGYGLAAKLDRRAVRLLFPMTFAFFLGWVANQIELAAIVGAFAAGLVINEQRLEAHDGDREQAEHSIEALISPLERTFAPLFFLLMGMQVNLSTFADPATLKIAAVLTGVAIAGKVICGWPAGPGVDRLSVGVGMIPRGEVGLIFASIGKNLGVVNDSVFSALVVMVMTTTLITPFWLKWSMDHPRKPSGDSLGAAPAPGLGPKPALDADVKGPSDNPASDISS